METILKKVLKHARVIRITLGVIGMVLVATGLIGYHFARAQTPASSPAPTAAPAPSAAMPMPMPAATATTAPAFNPADGDPNGSNTGGVGDITAATAGKPTPDEVNAQVGHNKIAINFVWTLLTGFLVFFMQAGFALVETGFTRAKNAAHTMLMNLAIYGLGVLGFYLLGFGLMFGGVGAVAQLGGTAPLVGHEFAVTIGGKVFGIIGTTGFMLGSHTYDVGVLALFLFQVVFMDAAATIPTGAMAERWKFSAFAIWGVFVSALMYPIYGNWVWGGGWLSALGTNYRLGHGVVDFAGSSVVHAVGGIASIAGVMVLGARIGKFRKDGTPVAIPGHNMTLAILGGMILAFGWFGFNPGSTLAGTDLRISVVAVNTMLASIAGMLTAMFIMWKNGKPDPGMTTNGFLAGLVAITAPSAFVSPFGALCIGIISGFLVIGAAWFVEWKLKLDDPVGAIAVHGANGLFGLLSVGLFADGTYGDGYNNVAGPVKGLFYGGVPQFWAQLIGVVVCFVFVFGVSWLFFKTIDLIMGMRVSAESELMGIDIPEVGALAYPRDDIFGSIFTAAAPQGNSNGNGSKKATVPAK